MELHTLWFVVIAVLWVGYFFLEGFDFGIGVLTGTLARDRAERRVLINTIGPVWDGNEVWLLTAAGATFAAFPDWYATLFSGFYLPLLLILVCLIVRGVAFEYRAKRPEERWQRGWEHAIFVSSLVVSVLWGVAFANIVRGVPIDAEGEFVGDVGDLLSPYALLGGAVSLALFTLHGALFAALKTVGDIRARARRLAGRLGLVGGALTVGWLGWTLAEADTWRAAPALVVAVLALVGALAANARGREGWAFLSSGVLVVAVVALWFLTLFPDVMPSSLDPAWSLTAADSASSPYTLRIMTWCAALATPLVLLYQGWTYWVFRKRIGTQHLAPAAHGADAEPADAPEPAGTGTPT
ncbi:cytochrome d ubiquinol oxidase subunit II [Streptomyces sp. 3MP-14]|uniref:Cytochrome d ubiquinol oxidase subunit II n=1 Tax=Streptomyces mimosae TaxID=2586635 RepID=A0A5N6A5X2_9ACTN|nr:MULTISPECIES: cytochrome d ubiquinol oxidase subunit II [Streptomyces]KAB8163383.1 cytochrome d ubiquinol oxidase subunit II [Streptomyces mimosae]KAB8174660.1 cytochrome d ubiquinol oxidase subunit II [Streptomyces sp. 3MP-14]